MSYNHNWFNEHQISTNKVVNFLFNYFFKIWMKLTETMLSVKVWILFATFWVNTWLLINGYINGDNYASIIAPIICALVMAREVWKIGRVFLNRGEIEDDSDSSDNDDSDDSHDHTPPPKAI